ncbi:hypothetical protein [Paenibacillus sp. YN15]|uniref:hypothetical protein n=1 Tax=Paenibacillus sp. YN15 TaxID=1742774 RepID=UPI001C655B88|nr:hypothetical protein [Paenibacillus sp. YN15]
MIEFFTFIDKFNENKCFLRLRNEKAGEKNGRTPSNKPRFGAGLRRFGLQLESLGAEAPDFPACRKKERMRSFFHLYSQVGVRFGKQ